MAKMTRPPETRRWGGPGSSRDDATKPPPEEHPKGARAPGRMTRHSQVSGGGGERDVHHGHDPRRKRDFQAGSEEKSRD